MLMAFFVVVACRLGQIRISQSAKLVALAERQHHSSTVLKARRGLIFDARGRVLAGTEDRKSVFVDPALVDDPDIVAKFLGPILGIDHEAIVERLITSPSPRYVLLKRGLSNVEAASIRELKLYGVGLFDEPKRRYPHGSLMAHVLGFVGADGDGLEGVEKQFNKYLRGKDGRLVALRTPSRRSIRSKDDEFVAPVDGDHVVLTLDAVIQGVLESELAGVVDEFDAEGAVGVVMSPQDGDVYAMACVPTYDPNRYGDCPASVRRNRVITDPFEPGSVFKPFIASGVLAEGAVDYDEPIFCHNGEGRFGNRVLHDSHPCGWITFPEILIQSSNIGMAIMGSRIGNRGIHKYVTAFGFGKSTGVGLPGESRGLVNPLSEWTSWSTSSITMGQEIGVTPLQLACAFSVLANDGVLVRPRVLKTILSPTGEARLPVAVPEVVRRVVPTDIARTMSQRVLVEVVNQSFGQVAVLADYHVLGKTGTAQVPHHDKRGYEPGAYVGSFVGAAPASDPQVVALVMVIKPDPGLGYYGRVVAAPAVREILRASLAYLEVPPDKNVVPEVPVDRVAFAVE